MLDLSVQSAMCLKTELIMKLSLDDITSLLKLQNNDGNLKSENSDFELLKLILENICLRIGSNLTQTASCSIDVNDQMFDQLENILAWSFKTCTILHEKHSIGNKNDVVSLTMFGENMLAFLHSLSNSMLSKVSHSLRCRRSASKFQHMLYHCGSKNAVYLDGWINSLKASEKILEEIVSTNVVSNGDEDTNKRKNTSSGGSKLKKKKTLRILS